MTGRLCFALLALLAVGISGYPVDVPVDAPVSSEEVHEPVPSKVQEEEAKVEAAVEDVVKEEEALQVRKDEELPVAQPALPEDESQEDKILDVKSEEESKPVLDDQGFDSYDEDKDGFIDRLEWERRAEIEEAKKKFLDADANNDERISQEEYQSWSSLPDPQENVNEVYVPLDVVSQPVDEIALAPVGRSAEEVGASEVKDVIVDVAPAVVDSEAGPIVLDDVPLGPVPVQEGGPIVESLGAGSQEEPIVIVKDEPVIVEEVLIEDKKDVVVQEEPKLVEVGPQVKSVEVPVDDIKEPESLNPEEKPVVLPASAPEAAQPVDSQDKPKVEAVLTESAPVEEAKKEIAVAEEVKVEVVSEAAQPSSSDLPVSSEKPDDPKPSNVILS